ncbi:MAG: ACP S-malonyltransferase [Kiritimatiellaeota bacterium]|nr:ACP S-malonyltransferase [Kiritimatiellota bacterium]
MNALLFAGQGAQTVGMGRDLAEAYPECMALYTRANEILGYDLAKICWEGPESELVKSNHCQPAIFVTSAVCCRALQRERKTLAIQSTAGLSLGEWAALWLAEAVSFEEALRILEARGRFIQEACEERESAMLSVIGLEVTKLKAVAAAAGVEIANYNSPEQTVLSGARTGIQAAEKLVKEAGAKRAIMLNVAGAYHSSLMASAAQRLEAFIRDLPIRPPCLPVISNVTGQPHGTPDDIRRQMVLQVTSPVQWVACVQRLQQQGVMRYIECGPGRVLSGLVKRIHPEAELNNVQDCPSLTKTLADISAE